MRDNGPVTTNLRFLMVAILTQPICAVSLGCQGNEPLASDTNVSHSRATGVAKSTPKNRDRDKPGVDHVSISYVYSLELNIEGARTKIKLDENSHWYAGAVGTAYDMLHIPANPTVYALIRVKGKGTFIIPERIKEADNRKAFVTFAAPQDWVGRDFIIEVWRDSADSDKFWHVVLSTTTFEATAEANAKVRLPVPAAIPVEASAGAGAILKVKTDKHTFDGVKLVADKLICVAEGRVIPKCGESTESSLKGDIASLLTTKSKLLLGKAVVENHGAVK